MGSRDIVHQLTEEMGMNQQMLQNMQPGQMQPAQMQGGGVDFSQLSADQQVLMMQQAQGQQIDDREEIPRRRRSSKPEKWESSSNGSSTDSSVSAEMNLDKLGLNGDSGMFDKMFHYFKNPFIVFAIFVLLSLIQVDGALKPLLPSSLATGLYYIIIKAIIAASAFLLINLVL